MSWYLRSIRDRDTHRAEQLRTNGTVVADCGVEFVPRLLPFGRIALRGNPLDPDQICPACAKRREDQVRPPDGRRATPLPAHNGRRAP